MYNMYNMTPKTNPNEEFRPSQSNSPGVGLAEMTKFAGNSKRATSYFTKEKKKKKKKVKKKGKKKNLSFGLVCSSTGTDSSKGGKRQVEGKGKGPTMPDSALLMRPHEYRTGNRIV